MTGDRCPNSIFDPADLLQFRNVDHNLEAMERLCRLFECEVGDLFEFVAED